jgi:7,8-dihydropterin-6-yl-methyl-4-(beta-D-ribofuranosyl)aminobenzene 5'-phosphate synthase
MSHAYHDSHVCHDSGVSRRDVLCAGGAVMLSYLVMDLSGGAKSVRAQALNGPVPEVDRLAVRVVTDSYQLAIAPNMKVGEVEVQRFGMPPAGKSLLGEFGLAMHLESRRGNETRNMLLDFGFTPETLNNNLRMLGIVPEGIDALILSHGHYDHFGGLVGFLQQHRGQLQADLSLYLGGEECFCTREWTIGKPQDFGFLDRKALADAQVKVVFAETPAVLAGHAFTTGHIALEDALIEAVDIQLCPIRKKNSKRAVPPYRAYVQHYYRKRIETVGSLSERILPNTIHAVTAEGFELKVFLFVLAYSINCL